MDSRVDPAGVYTFGTGIQGTSIPDQTSVHLHLRASRTLSVLSRRTSPANFIPQPCGNLAHPTHPVLSSRLNLVQYCSSPRTPTTADITIVLTRTCEVPCSFTHKPRGRSSPALPSPCIPSTTNISVPISLLLTNFAWTTRSMRSKRSAKCYRLTMPVYIRHIIPY